MTGKQTILVADDSPTIRSIIAEGLTEAYEVLVAKDGLEAVRLFERDARSVAAVVADLRMPRLNGRMVAEWVHHINPSIPVIVMSSSARNREINELLKDPAVTYLAKPFDLPLLESLLEELLIRES